MFKQAFKLTTVLIVLCGIIFPLSVTGISHLIFNDKSEGSLIKINGKVVGSELLGQSFKDDKFFKGRVSGSLNMGPTNKSLEERIKNNNWNKTEGVPLDLVTNSGSDLDPDITVEAARFQVPYVSKASGISEEKLNGFIDEIKQDEQLEFIGDERVNVLKLNIEVAKSIGII